MTRSMTIAACLALFACGPRKPELSKAEALPKLRKYILETPAVFGRVIYNPPTIPDLDTQIENEIEKRNFGRMPHNDANAKHLATSMAATIWGRYLDTPDGRAEVESRIRSHWDNPDVSTEKLNGVVADLGLCPGSLQRGARGSLELRNCEFFDHGELKTAELVRRLQNLTAQYPNAKAYNLSVTFTEYRSPKAVHYRWEPSSDRLYVTIKRTTYRSKARIGGFDKLLSVESTSRTGQMETIPGNLRVGPPR